MMNGSDKRMLDREALRNMIQQWNMNRLDLFELSEPNEDLSFHGVMRFYFQDSGQKVATKCIRVASDATVGDVIETLIEKFRPDMRMLSVNSYALYEIHSQEERKLANDEKPLLVQLNWHSDDREGRFLLKNVDDKTVSMVSGIDTNTNFKRKLSKREKKELKKKEKLSRMKSDAAKDDKHPVAEKLYNELPETIFTRSISNPEAVMRRRRQQKLEKKLQQFRSKDGGPDTGGTLKIYGESLCSDVPYKTLLLSINDCSASVVREMLDKYGLGKIDPQLYCLVQVNTQDNSEYILDDDECPLAIVMAHSQRGSIMFHVRRRPADCQPRRRKKKSGSIRAGSNSAGNGLCAGLLIETQPDGTVIDNGRTIRIAGDIVEVGSANGVTLQLYGPSIQPRHCVIAMNEGVVTIKPLHADAYTYVNGQRIHHMTILQHGCLIKFGRMSTFRFVDPGQENKLNRNLSQSQHFDSGSVYDRSPTSPIPDNSSGIISPLSQSAHSHLDIIQSSLDPSGINSTSGSDFQRAMSPILSSNKMGSQDNFGVGYNKNTMETTDTLSNYAINNNNNNVKMEDEALMMSQHLANSKTDLLQDNQYNLTYNGINNSQTLPMLNDQSNSNKTPNNPCKDNYETTFDLDGNVETKSICSAKSGGSGHENNRLPRGQEAILPAVLEFPENTQQIFLQNVITRLDVNAPAFKLAPVYTLYLCARYRASTHYRPDLTPTERAQKLTALLHHIATLIQNVVQERYSEAAVQAFWMANASELLHFLRCDRHISAFTVQAQDILAHTVKNSFSNLMACFHIELSQVLTPFLDENSSEVDAVGAVISALSSAMALLRRCRVNAALTIQLFSQLFHYINVWCFNKVVTSSYMWCAGWGGLISARLAPINAWAERQGLEFAAECYLALIHQCAHLLQAPKNTHEDIANLTSTCFKLNSVQLRCLLGGFTEEVSGSIRHLPPDIVETAVKHAQGVADELHRADGREITLEESSLLPVSLLIPEDGFSADVVRGLPSGFAEFLTPLQRAGLCRLAPQPHSQGHWTVYMNGYGSSVSVKPTQQPVIQHIQLQKNSNGMGLSIVAAKGAGQSKLGIYIKSVVPGGAAAADQRLQAGDQLLAVDGHSLVGITQEKAAEYLVRTGPVVTLQVAKQGAVLHGLATLLRQPSPQTNRDLFQSGFISSSEESLSNQLRFISGFENDVGGEYFDVEDTFNNNPEYYVSENKFALPRVSVTDFDEVQSSAIRVACRRFDFATANSDYVDSSNQSYDSDCSYPECMTKLNDNIYSRLNNLDTLNHNECTSYKSTRNAEESIKASDVLHTLEAQKSCGDFEEIPYIDEETNSVDLGVIDGNPLGEYYIKIENIPKISISEVTDEFDKLDLEKKESCNVATCVNFDDISSSTVSEQNPSNLKSITEQNDFLWKSPSDQNFFSKNLVERKKYSNNLNQKNINFRDKKDNMTFDKFSFNEKRIFAMEANEYNILDSSENISAELNEMTKEKYISSGSTPLDDYNELVKLENKLSCTTSIQKDKNIDLSVQSDVDDDSIIKTLKLGSGKVKALTKHFNDINLVYQHKLYKRNCQSNLDISCCGEKVKNNLKSAQSSSLDSLKSILKENSSIDKVEHDKISAEEQKNILAVLEDWAKHGSNSKLDDFTTNKNNCSLINNMNLTSTFSLESKDNKRESIDVKCIKSRTCSYNPNKIMERKRKDQNPKISSCKKSDTINMSLSDNLKNLGNSDKKFENRKKQIPLIEKTKLVLPRKKFPQSYIVKKKTTHNSNNIYNNSVRSCPNLSTISDVHKTTGLRKNVVNISCPDINKRFFTNRKCRPENSSYLKVCRIRDNTDLKDRPPTPRYAWIQYGPLSRSKKYALSCENMSPRRMSERDLPSKLEMEQNSVGTNLSSTVKSSKSVPALHEHSKHHEVFNPGYSRTSSNNSIPAMIGLKTKSNQPQQSQISDQNNFYQNLSVYRNTGLGERSSALRNSQNNLQLHATLPKANINIDNQGMIQHQSMTDRLTSGQRPQSAYYGCQINPNLQNANGIRTAQSIKDLQTSSDNYPSGYQRNNFPSMPNVNQGYNMNMVGNNANSLAQSSATYTSSSSSSMGRGSLGNNYNQMPNMSNQFPAQNSMNQYQSVPNIQNAYLSQNSNVNQLPNGSVNHGMGNAAILRGQAKLAEMSEEVTRRQQRASMNADSTLLSPVQHNRFHYSQDNFNNMPMSPNIPMSPTKQQPPVAPKPQGLKRGVSGEISIQDGVEGPPLPPTNTHPLFHQQHSDEKSYFASTSDPPAVSFYPTQRPQHTQSHAPPNPWEREEREKELEARRFAARVWRDQQIDTLQALGDDNRTPQQEQQLRALTLERDFQRRAQEAQIEDEDKVLGANDAEARNQETGSHGGLLRVANSNNNPCADLNLVPVSSNIVSSIQPVSVATSNINGNDQQQDNVNQQENRVTNQPPPTSTIQPKSILKSNLRLDNLNSNSPQSPNKSQKNASFSNNLTPQSLKFDNVSKYEQVNTTNSKYDHNINNKYEPNISTKFENSPLKYPDQMNNLGPKYEQQQYSYNANTTIPQPNLNTSTNQLTQAMSELYVNSSGNYSRMDNVNSNTRYEPQYYGQENKSQNAPPPPERGSSFAIMSQQHALRSNLSTSSQVSGQNQNLNNVGNNNVSFKDKRVSFHDNDTSTLLSNSNVEKQENEMETIREDPDKFIMEAESMLQSPTTPSSSNIMHTPGVIGAQEVYRDPRQKRLAEQQKAQQAGNTPIPEKLSFKEKMKMFALESGETNTPKDKVKISRAQRDIDAVH